MQVPSLLQHGRRPGGIAGGLTVLIVIFFLSGAMSVARAEPDAYEPNDTAESARAILLNDQDPAHTQIPGYDWKQLHNFHQANDEDWIIYYAHARSIFYKIEVLSPGPNCDALIEVFSADDLDNPILSKDDRPAGEAEYAEWAVHQDGLYYIRIRPYDGNVYGPGTDYELVLSIPAGTFVGFVYGTVAPMVRTILTTDGKGEAITLDNGFFAMPHLAGSGFLLSARADGYPVYSQKIDVSEFGATHLAIVLDDDGDADNDGFTQDQGDCDDDNASVYPGAQEICGDGIDQDCDGADLSCTGTVDGYAITSDLWAKAVLEVTGSPVTLVWKLMGADITPSGDQVISGYFYADPDDFTYGSVYNPELFVKIYIATNGWCNMAFNHVTVDDVSVYSMGGEASQSSTATLNTRLVEHQYSGVSIETSLQTTGETAASSTGEGYTLSSGLWARAVLQPSTGDVNLIWKQVGTDTTPSGDTVVSGYFYASPEDFPYGSLYNPEVFVKVYIAANGWANMAFNHVTVDTVAIASARDADGTDGQSATASLGNRLVEHAYTGVGLQ